MTTKKKIILAGGTGFLGKHLARHLVKEGYEVVVLTRRFNTQTTPYRFAFWDGMTKGEFMSTLRKHAGGIGRFFGIPLPRWALEIGASSAPKPNLYSRAAKLSPET